MTPIETVLHYHNVTKHHPHRYARSLGYLDWANQPDPFRRYQGAPTIPLLLLPQDPLPLYDDLYTPGAVMPHPVCVDSISDFMQYSLALSAWKQFRGSRWALRINPSSGNLHPTEGYLLMGAVRGLANSPGVFHYAPRDHLLERRCTIQPDVWGTLLRGLPADTFFVALTSIHWREAWKYGERAYRYCQHDAGHALAALALGAAVHGWGVHPVSDLGDAEIGALLGLDRPPDFQETEREHPDLVIAVTPHEWSNLPIRLPEDAISSMQTGEWFGRANLLSADHVDWKVIDGAATACAKPPTTAAAPVAMAPTLPSVEPKRPPAAARQIIFQRRSALAMDGHTTLTAEQFFLMMDRVVPRFDRPPWTGLGPPARIHLAIFVHLVEGLAPGLYCLVRSSTGLADLRKATRPEFSWQQPDGCPGSLSFYRLALGDFRRLAGHVCCGQDIAADGVFSLGMIAEFEKPLRKVGPWVYRRLHWETGAIGQVLYLEAEAAGIRSTGIGCFFDDVMHEVLGLRGAQFQTLYHFTVGGQVEDPRLTSLPPYQGIGGADAKA